VAEENRSTLMLINQGFGVLPVHRQLALVLGTALAIALGITVYMWAKTPNFRVLYNGLAEKDVVQVTDALQKAGIEFELKDGGTVLVPGEQVHTARIRLAAHGLPNSTSQGFELLEKDPGFGTSQFLERARYQRAMEGELARTVASIRSVENARVHLAIPRQSAFVRDRKPPRASVMVKLFPGRTLDDTQVAAIVHMVASAIPELDAGHVTVVDQQGRLLTAPDSSGTMGLTAGQFAHQKKLESYYISRIESLIEPLVGVGKVRAQVAAEIDYSYTEQTRESYNPDLPAIRSEQTIEEQTVGRAGGAGGVPGALTNQPPQTGTAATPEGTTAESGPQRTNRRITKNYELDRTISHVRLPVGSVRRLSVAVVLDDKLIVNDQGEQIRQPLTEEEIDRITRLVRDAVGYDARRGDTVSVINASFSIPPEPEPLPEPPLLEQPWVWDAIKIGGAVVALLLLIFNVFRPVMRSLAEKGATVPLPAPPEPARVDHNPEADVPKLPSFTEFDAQIQGAKNMAREDPKRVAQVVKQWVSNDG